jgi:hypothetical protein
MPSLRGLVALIFVSACMTAFAHAQNREERFISARAGGINLVSGDVKVRSVSKDDWQMLSVKDDLKSGDAVRAGASGRVEVLLNPGSYFRTGDGAEFEFTDTSLDNLQLKLTRGSAVVEATGYDGLDLSITINTPQTRVRIVRGGVYRINILASGYTEVAVEKGRATIGDAPGTTVKGGKFARVGADGIAVAKLDKKNRDAFDKWSRERGRELAQANDKLANRTTNSLLARTSFYDFFKAEYRSNPLGLWLWSARYGCYTFLPFYSDWRSPYGFGYGSWFTPFGFEPNCSSCRPSATQPFIVNNGTTSNTPTGTYNPPGTASGGRTTSGSPQPAPMPQPPPTTVDRSERPTRERTIEPGSPPLDQ